MLGGIGHHVVSVDADTAKIAAIERGEVPIHEHLLPQLLERHRGNRLMFSLFHQFFGTGSGGGVYYGGNAAGGKREPDLSCVESVASEIASAISEPKLIVEKSTVPVCTCESIRKVLSLHGAPAGRFFVASNPEFLREGTAVTDFLYPDRIVLGVDDDFSAAMLYSIYQPLAEETYYQKEDAIPSPRSSKGRRVCIVTNANK